MCNRQMISLLTVCKKQNAFLHLHKSRDYLCMIMALIDLIYVIIAIYFLYKLVFSFLVPVSKTVSSVKHQMRNMQNNQAAQEPQQNPYTSASRHNKNSTASTDSEYIDFEEVK